MNFKSRRVCVVGAGKWGENHLRVLNGLGVLSGIVEKDESRLKYFGDLFGEVELYSSLNSAFSSFFDGYVVATPASTHFDISKRIIENGNHVLVEKPLAMRVRDAEALRELASSKSVNLMVGHLLLFHPAIIRIKRLIDEKRIGKLQYLYSNRLNLGTVRTEENILWSFAPHDISIFQFLLEAFPSSLICQGGVFLQSDVYDTTMTVLEYPGNIVGHIFLSWLHPFKEHRIVVIGSEGMISFEDSSDDRAIYLYDKKIDLIKGNPVVKDGNAEKIDYEHKMPLTEELRYFVDHLNGDPIQVANSEHGIEVLRILEAASNYLDKN
ncbi:MAG: oxidoreductase [Candidatus Marinimicrobia bacterium]|nr:oxidoreductase [Candidatus Neomarinimicrobiota bacterium]